MQSAFTRHPATRCLNSLPGAKAGTRVAAICIFSPVFGLRPFTRLAIANFKVPNPTNEILSPDETASTIVLYHCRNDGISLSFGHISFLGDRVNQFAFIHNLSSLNTEAILV
jgi:hypothetical protein